jgi:hypothetical protein
MRFGFEVTMYVCNRKAAHPTQTTTGALAPVVVCVG